MKEKIKQILLQKLAAQYVDVKDESAQHAGHSEAIKSGGGHYAVVVVSSRFAGKKLLERHRMIYHALVDLKTDIHALAIQALTPKEWKGRGEER